jgi:hypothetical protein
MAENAKAVPFGYENLNGPIPMYLDILSRWPTSIPASTQWCVYIEINDLPLLKSNFLTTLKNLEMIGGADSWEVSKKIIEIFASKSNTNPHDIYPFCAFASDVSLPSDTIDASNEGLQFGAFQAPVTSKGRGNYQKFTVSFLETNLSFVDLFIRQWMILTGHYGFVTRSDATKNIKLPKLDILFYGKNGSGINQINRKIIRFFNVAPVSVEGSSLGYNTDTAVQKYRVSFVYDSYCILAAQANEKSGDSSFLNADTNFVQNTTRNDVGITGFSINENRQKNNSPVTTTMNIEYGNLEQTTIGGVTRSKFNTSKLPFKLKP